MSHWKHSEGCLLRPPLGRFCPKLLCVSYPACPLPLLRLPMRVDLKVPYSDKEQAKKLGARWDAAAKTWYVMDVTDLWPFLKWMPKHLTEPHKTVVVVKVENVKPAKKKRQVKSKKAHDKAMKRIEAKNTHFIVGPTTPRTDFSMFDPGCSCVPWEWCEHNPAPDVPIMSDQLEHIRSIMAE